MRIRVYIFIAILTAGAIGKDLDRFAPIQFGYRAWSGAGTAFSTYASKRKFEVALPKVAVGPQWEHGKKHPPLSAAEAIALAIEKAKGFIKDDDGIDRDVDLAWGIKDATLSPWKPEQGYWYWSIKLEQRPDFGAGGGGYSGPLPTVVLMVLMDGTVIKPQVPANKR